MRVLNTSLIAFLVTASSLALTGCLGTNTPPSIGSAFNVSSVGTTYSSVRGAGFEDATITANAGAITGATIGSASSGAAFTSSGSLAGFTIAIPADASSSGAADTVATGSGQFTTPTGAIFPTGTLQASDTTTALQPILIDKFGAAEGLNYTEYGMWLEPGAISTSTTTTNTAVFAVGIPTTAMPTTGTAIYTGGAAGIASDGTTTAGEFTGKATMTANFSVGAGTISGSITGINYSAAGNNGAITGTMDNINMTGGTIAGNTFSGTGIAAVNGTTTGGAPNMDNANTGRFGGTFNGPSAQEIGGSFQLTGGGAKVIGSFGGKD